ncbi:MAG TPA: hypothetical protein ENN67_01950, partial [Firmicutes bacterium]|nr:hypothetical protein [Bacillota bacterium]
MYRFFIPFGITILAAMIIGCSNSTAPVEPSNTPDISRPRLSETDSNRALWGMWHCEIDPETLQVEIIPVRTADFTCNVTKFLQPPNAPMHMLYITILSGSNPSEGYIIADVTVRHPFVGIAYYRGFDVRGILMSDGSTVSG